MAGTESDGLFGRVSGADVRLAPFYSPASIGLRTFGVLRPMLAGLFGALTAARQYLILPLTCIGARCRDLAQRPSLPNFGLPAPRNSRGRQARIAARALRTGGTGK